MSVEPASDSRDHTVGIVVVSHSYRLAEGVVELAREMAGPNSRLVAVGGLALPDHPLGTDAAAIKQGIEQVYSDDGVLVLMDLGSAILSAELAVEMLPAAWRQHVALGAAPLVEGAIAAAVQARLGSPLAQVLDEARAALIPKIEHLGTPDPTVVPVANGVPEDQSLHPGSHDLRLTIRGPLGLHARPAARLVRLVARFNADVLLFDVSTGRGPANAKSITAVSTLGALPGHEILASASGPDAALAISAIRHLADANFGDEAAESSDAVAAGVSSPTIAVSNVDASRTTGTGVMATLRGLPGSSGIAIGRVRRFLASAAEPNEDHVDDPDLELERLRTALERVHRRIEDSRDALIRRGEASLADIFEAHLLFLDDAALLEPTRKAILDDRLNAAAAWQHAVDAVVTRYHAVADDYLRTRADDVADVGRQVLVEVLGTAPAMAVLDEPSILVAAELGPGDVARVDPALILGVCTVRGGPTSHLAILARSSSIPFVFGLDQGILDVADGTTVIVDGEAGTVLVNPDPTATTDYVQKADAMRADLAAAQAARTTAAITRDGSRIRILANVSAAADVPVAIAAGAEGVGLFRTEYLFLNRDAPPGESEQADAYRSVADALRGHPLVIRTLDVGGDKPLRFQRGNLEANPFLGCRGIRWCLTHPDLFKTQLRAIVKVAATYPVKVMFPMIATLDEFRIARSMLMEARSEVEQSGQAVPARIESGMMVELPSAAVQAARFAAEADFFSIGTNDLAQYTFAADRGNPRVAALADAFQPAVLRLIAQVVEAAHARGKSVAVCGELAGDPRAAPILVGLGVDELSMNPSDVPRVKQAIRSLNRASAQELAMRALDLEAGAAVRSLRANAVP